MKKILYLASKNPGKIREMNSELSFFKDHFLVKNALDLDFPSPEETGKTFKENASLKSRHFLNFLKKKKLPFDYVLAEDSGLEVFCLDKEPGIFSARYSEKSNPMAKDRDLANNELLIENLKDKKEREAQFVCVISLLDQSLKETFFEGSVEGRIADQIQSGGGFGYDYVFIPKGQGQTFSKTPELKLQISHRKKALKKCLDYLTK